MIAFASRTRLIAGSRPFGGDVYARLAAGSPACVPVRKGGILGGENDAFSCAPRRAGGVCHARFRVASRIEPARPRAPPRMRAQRLGSFPQKSPSGVTHEP